MHYRMRKLVNKDGRKEKAEILNTFRCTTIANVGWRRCTCKVRLIGLEIHLGISRQFLCGVIRDVMVSFSNIHR